MRKRWLVNGGHLALALRARTRNIPRIDIALDSHTRRHWIEGLHGSEADDERMLVRYGELLADIQPAPIAKSMTDQLSRWFARHRVKFATS